MRPQAHAGERGAERMERETKWAGWFALVLGCVGIVAGASLLVGGVAPAEGFSCKALCGLALLAADTLGAWAGTLVGSLLWLGVGAVFCWLGCRLLKA